MGGYTTHPDSNTSRGHIIDGSEGSLKAKSMGVSDMNTIYYSCHSGLFYAQESNDILDCIKEEFAERNGRGKIICYPKIFASLEFRHKPDVDKFEAIYRSDVMVIYPNQWHLDSSQKWDIKVYEAIARGKKELYVVLPGRRVVRALIIEGEVLPQKQIEGRKVEVS